MAVTAARPSTHDDLVIVDIDVHVSDTPEALAPYVDAPYRRVLEHISTLPRRYSGRAGICPQARDRSAPA